MRVNDGKIKVESLVLYADVHRNIPELGGYQNGIYHHREWDLRDMVGEKFEEGPSLEGLAMEIVEDKMLDPVPNVTYCIDFGMYDRTSGFHWDWHKWRLNETPFVVEYFDDGTVCAGWGRDFMYPWWIGCPSKYADRWNLGMKAAWELKETFGDRTPDIVKDDQACEGAFKEYLAQEITRARAADAEANKGRLVEMLKDMGMDVGKIQGFLEKWQRWSTLAPDVARRSWKEFELEDRETAPELDG